MPIKDPTIYPPYWKQFSEHIRFERAGNKCEKCGIPNGMWKATLSSDSGHSTMLFHKSEDAYLTANSNWEFIVRPPTRVVLTVAHLDNEGGICDCKARTGRKCAIPDHVLALCQACHLMLDTPKRIENRRQTMITRKDARRGLLAGMEVAGA